MKYNYHIVWIRSVRTQFEKKIVYGQRFILFFIFFNNLQTLSCLIKIVTDFINFQLSKRKQKEICKFTAGKIPKLTPTFFAKHHHYSMDFTNSDIQIQKNKGHSSLYFEIHELCSCPFSAYQGSASQHFRIIILRCLRHSFLNTYILQIAQRIQQNNCEIITIFFSKTITIFTKK